MPSDLMSHHVRDGVLAGANVTAAQGSFQGAPVLEAAPWTATARGSLGNWPALTG
eukprot:SAG22_NODE_17198_length_310_cov_0.284360_1_plen_54_part_10